MPPRAEAAAEPKLAVKKRYVTCIVNEGWLASLVIHKVYEVLPDEIAEKAGMLRVIDESGESYIYPKKLFVEKPAGK